MHPHLNCPLCNPNPFYNPGPADDHTNDVLLYSLTTFLVANGHTRCWQDVAAKMLKEFTIAKKEK